jgi:hypothetical protein
MSQCEVLVRFHDWRAARNRKPATRRRRRCRCIRVVAVPVSIGLAALVLVAGRSPSTLPVRSALAPKQDLYFGTGR